MWAQRANADMLPCPACRHVNPKLADLTIEKLLGQPHKCEKCLCEFMVDVLAYKATIPQYPAAYQDAAEAMSLGDI